MWNVLLVGFVAFSLHNEIACYVPRGKRETAGALDIITNNAHSIHADIQSENSAAGPYKPARGPENNGTGPKNAATGPEYTANDVVKTCFKAYKNTIPSSIESGIVFQVTPPKLPYEIKSFRKSLPVNTKLDLLRGITRVVTLATLIISAALEFYPIVYNLYEFAYDFLYYKY